MRMDAGRGGVDAASAGHSFSSSSSRRPGSDQFASVAVCCAQEALLYTHTHSRIYTHLSSISPGKLLT